MATVQNASATNATKALAGGIATIGRGIIDGRVKVMLDVMTVDTSYSSSSTFKIGGVLPTGANVIGFIFYNSASQTWTISAGDSNSATRYVSASTGMQTAAATTVISGLNYVIGTNTGDNQILLTTGTATSAAGSLYVAILYTQD